jgi:hypothetical protein
MARYASISDHGLIGDLQTTALVTTDGTVDCSAVRGSTPPSVFAGR